VINYRYRCDVRQKIKDRDFLYVFIVLYLFLKLKHRSFKSSFYPGRSLIIYA